MLLSNSFDAVSIKESFTAFDRFNFVQSTQIFYRVPSAIPNKFPNFHRIKLKCLKKIDGIQLKAIFEQNQNVSCHKIRFIFLSACNFDGFFFSFLTSEFICIAAVFLLSHLLLLK